MCDTREGTGSSLPDWGVRIDGGRTQSTIQNFEQCTSVIAWGCWLGREIGVDATVELYTSGALWHSRVYVVIHSSRSTPLIMGDVADGTCRAIDIFRLVQYPAKRVITQYIAFRTCHLIRAGPIGYSYFYFVFTFEERQHTIWQTSQAGVCTGQSIVETDYEFNKLKLRSAQFYKNGKQR
jgi:hypothetical protein